MGKKCPEAKCFAVSCLAVEQLLAKNCGDGSQICQLYRKLETTKAEEGNCKCKPQMSDELCSPAQLWSAPLVFLGTSKAHVMSSFWHWLLRKQTMDR